MRFLVVKDRVEEQELITLRLQHHFDDLQLATVTDAASLHQALERGPFDLVLTDYRLGWTDGLQVLRQIKGRTPEVPVILIADAEDAEIAVEGIQAGLSDCLLRQHLEYLPAVIRTSLERARLQQELDRSLQELRQSRDELEARVEERTAELRQRESELQLTINATPALISYIDTDFCCRRVNGTAARWFGLAKQEMEGRPLQDTVGPAAWEAIRPHAERALAGETVTYEQESPYEPGGPRWVRATYTPDRDEMGRVRGFIAHLLDIGEQRRVEEELRRSEEKYRHLVRNAPAFIYELDFRGPRFTDANEMVCEYLGYTREELMAVNPLDLMEEKDRMLFRARIERWLHGEKPDESVEYRVRAKDGREYDALLNVTFTADEQGRPIGATVIGQDITARKRAEVALAKAKQQLEVRLAEQTAELWLANQRLQAVLQALPVGVWITDREGRIVETNPQANEVWAGEAPRSENIEGYRAYRCWFPGTGQEVQPGEQPLARVLATGERIPRFELEIERFDGSRGIILTAAAPILDPEKTIVGAVGISQDVTALRQVEEALRENEARRQVAEAVEVERKRLFEMLEALPVMVCLLTPDYHVAFANRSFRDRFGESQGRTCADGKTVVATIAQGQDITERKQAEQEREQLLEQVRRDAETKATLLREVNHRVKNNLGAIIGLLYAQLDRPGVTDQSEYRAAIQEVTHRIEGLSVVHGLLSKSQWTPLRLDELAERIVGAALQSLPIDQVQVEVKPSPVLVSPDQAHTLSLVLNELALNVGKHALRTAASVCVTAITTVQEGQAVFAFRDNGPGYPEEVLTGRQVGVGLGLLRNLVRQNLRGQLALRNESGAVAEIRFPVAE